MDFCLLESSECRVLAPSLLGGCLGRVGADVGRVGFVALAGPTAAGFLGGPALPNGGEVLAARAVGLIAAAAAFPSNRFGAILATILTARVCSARTRFAAPRCLAQGTFQRTHGRRSRANQCFL